MKKIVFYTNPIDPNKLALVITQDGETAKDLIEKGIIGKKDKFVEQDFNISAESDLEHLIGIYFGAEMLRFDDPKKPKDVVIEYEALHKFFLDKIRFLRTKAFEVLDRLGVRAISLSKFDVAKDIEADKEVLRNLPSTVNIYNIKTMTDTLTLVPAELVVDYEEKYKGRF